MQLENTTVSTLSAGLGKVKLRFKTRTLRGTIKKISQAPFHILILTPTVRHDQAVGHKTLAGLIVSNGQFCSRKTFFLIFQGPALKCKEATVTAK